MFYRGKHLFKINCHATKTSTFQRLSPVLFFIKKLRHKNNLQKRLSHITSNIIQKIQQNLSQILTDDILRNTLVNHQRFEVGA